ncbi:MAG: TraM recognition domain-containing protein [Pseudomonadota bacterium]
MTRSDDILDAPLLWLSPHDAITHRDLNQNVLVLGSPGAGKTTGTGSTLLKAMLLSGAGGLALCAKPDEAYQIRLIARACGREDSLLEWDGSIPGFNYLSYVMALSGSAGLNNVIEAVMDVEELARNVGANPGRASDEFWTASKLQVLRAGIPPIYAATGTVRIDDILRFVRSAPLSIDQMSDPAWQSRSYFFWVFWQARGRMPDVIAERALDYWRYDFASLDPKTRSNIVISLTTALDRFNHGWLRTAFCEETTIVPEMSFAGKVIVCNMPALTLHQDGILAQQIFKLFWQRAVLSRNGLDPQHRVRPVFLYADEAQYFLTPHDAAFLSTCRGSRASTIYLAQSLPTFYASMGGENARDRVHHLLGNFGTRVWHSNACAETNEWAARTLGKIMHQRSNYSSSEGSSTSYGMNMGAGTNTGSNWNHSSGHSGNMRGSSYNHQGSSGGSAGDSDNWGRNRGSGSNWGSSQGWSEQVDWVLEPGLFGRFLKTGGPAHGGRISAVWYQAGRRFVASSGNSLLAEFQQ